MGDKIRERSQSQEAWLIVQCFSFGETASDGLRRRPNAGVADGTRRRCNGGALGSCSERSLAYGGGLAFCHVAVGFLHASATSGVRSISYGIAIPVVVCLLVRLFTKGNATQREDEQDEETNITCPRPPHQESWIFSRRHHHRRKPERR